MNFNHKKMLVFPKGIRLANSHDLLGLPNSLELLHQVNMANIRQGYLTSSTEESPTQKYTEINIDSGACDFLQRKLISLDFPLVLVALDNRSDFYFQKVTRTLLILHSYGYYSAH